MDLLFIFEWIDSSKLAELSKAWGGLYAIVQTVHLSSMVLLGGMILLVDLRMLNVLMRDVSPDVLIDSAQKWLQWALLAIVLSGIFMMSAVAIKLYYNVFFLSKMLGLVLGVFFLYVIRNTLYRRAIGVIQPESDAGVGIENPNERIMPWVIKLVAIAHISTWFGVASAGRWIGFS